MPKTNGHLINFKVIIGSVIFGVGLFGVLVGILWSARNEAGARVPATAILKIIDAPTQTPIGFVLTPTPTSTPSPSASQAAPTPPTNSAIVVGNYVQVSGTGGDGLRIHDNPGVASEVNYVAIEAELFLVKAGPVDADGYTWWELEDPYNNNAVGWGVANYLVVVQNP